MADDKTWKSATSTSYDDAATIRGDPRFASVTQGAAPTHEIEYNPNIISDDSAASEHSGQRSPPPSAHASTKANFSSYSSNYSTTSTVTNVSTTPRNTDNTPVYAKPVKRKTTTFDDNVDMIENGIYENA